MALRDSETIIFETHSTSVDNEAGLASGLADVPLSARGEAEAEALGMRRRQEQFDVVCCSDLQRSYRTAEIAFGARFPILRDARLRECDYGLLTRARAADVEAVRAMYVSAAFPKGESYVEATERVESLLKELQHRYAGGRVLLIGHRATQYALDHLLRGISLEVAISAFWQWQPGWVYELSNDLEWNRRC